MAQQETQRPKSGKRWLKIVLFVSLAINLLIVGLVVGTVASGGVGKKMRERGDRGDAVAPFTRALTHDQRREVGRSFGKALRKKDRDRGHGARLSEEFQAAVTVIRTEPYDAAAFEAVLNNQAALAQGRMLEGQKILAAYVAEMTTEERASYADRLEEAVQEIGRKSRDNN